ncbi:serine O-acetyltransferase [Paucibacter sp. DJ2R-2]|uniref:serine O-acetyltransferase n=1 Tax=Paucibacter sp. DJ2R-2 TaxID=2893558 RepID=UPI0021E36FF3|nr:DapH/DapD/GlmU-related protein [Paucibacter sp. DJ2R-2]MCV2422816.1 serine acetyltransferase [Paucibacter sp. DJ4R-1]MCV2441043.1 serine acetyltransferase [Paucibacter sp. DJ2R-2]
MLKIFRASAWLQDRGVPLVPRLLYIFNRIVFSVALPPTVRVGERVLFGYSGLGIVVHARSVIGNDVKISQNVTIGGRSGFWGVPVIEDEVEIGAGACVLGPVRIGRGAKIGANAVVLSDIPPGSIAVGVPAKVRSPSKENS